MRTRHPSPLILVVTLVSFLALACGLQGTASPTADPNVVALAVQLTLQASGESPSGPPSLPPCRRQPLLT
jgi:hypothetical protein